ncbi:TPA: hypothetical protein P0E24_002369 [Vibrio campbellii]|nr:hypothetical protein [Vibrio campbellii]HDM8243288.1 hypothetical protein [Vibrio campbellii]
MLIQRKTLLVIAIASGLSGCGGDGSSSDNKPTPTPPAPGSETFYYAQDSVRQSTPTEQFYVDISSNMESSDGTLVSLTSVTPLVNDDSCDVLSQDSRGFTINATNVKVCDYRYRVGKSIISQSNSVQGNNYAEATVRAVVGATTESIMPIAANTSSNTSVTIDIVNLLGQHSYILDTDKYTLSTSVVLPNESKTGSTAIADVVGNSIEYTPGAGIVSGVERVLYSYSNGTDILAGTVDIAVSTEANNAPTASSAFVTNYIHPVSGETVSKIPYGLTTSIDVSDLINDVDGDTLQLIDVFTYDATLKIPEDANKDGNNFNDTVFEFEKSESGLTNVTYVVSDGKGGYATGVVQLLVGEAFSNIILDTSTPKIQYLAPLTEKAAVNANIKHTPVIGDGTSSILGLPIATLDWDSANGYCEATGGKLPTIEELEALNTFVDSEGGLFAGYEWPQNKAYWGSTEGTTSGNKQAFQFATGTVLDDESTVQSYYVTCVAQYSISRKLLGEPLLKPNPATVPAETPLPDEVYHYQIEETIASSVKIVDDSKVTWTLNGVLPHYANFDMSTGIVTVKTSKILPKDEGVSFTIHGCIESDCYEKDVTILLPWNRILSNANYEYSPLLTIEEKEALGGVGAAFEDPTNYTYGHKDTSILGKEWLELNVNDVAGYCDSLTFDGGGWSAWTLNEQAEGYFDLLVEMINIHGVEGDDANVLLNALNIKFEASTTGFPLASFASGIDDSYFGSIFMGNAPNVRHMGAAKSTGGGIDFKGYADQHMLAVCVRDAN